ncbi:MAG: class I SAM-dependent methyltransferase [Saprospiraceae bacterium]
MILQEAIDLIRPGIRNTSGTWADIGAGTGMFTLALMEILEEGKIIALDKSPHALYSILSTVSIEFEILEGDFQHPLLLPRLDGIIMANALHYAQDPIFVLHNILKSLKKESPLILIEYDTEMPNQPWVPYPVSFHRFTILCEHAGLKKPELIATHQSIYQDGNIYSAITHIDF